MEVEVEKEEEAETSPWFTHFPTVLLIRIMKLLSKDFSSIRNLSYTSKYLRSFILENIESIYTPHLHLDNFEAVGDVNYGNDIDFKKPVLSLKISNSFEESDIDPPSGTQGFLKSHMFYGQVYLNNPFLRLMNRLSDEMDFSQLKSLELRNNVSVLKPGYLHTKKRVAALDCDEKGQNFRKSLEILKIDINLVNIETIYSKERSLIEERNANLLPGDTIDNFENIIERFAVMHVLTGLDRTLSKLFGGSGGPKHFNVNRMEWVEAKPYRCEENALKDFEINLVPETDCDWFSYVEEKGFDYKQEMLWKKSIKYIVESFQRIIHLKKNHTRQICVKGIPRFLFNIMMESVYPSLDRATRTWYREDQQPLMPNPNHKCPFQITEKSRGKFFDMIIKFN